MTATVRITGLLVMLAAMPLFADEPEIDAFTGLKIAEGWEHVRANCIACHSTRLITQQRGNAAQWLAMIRWMQKKQNLWQFEPAVEAAIVSYLAANYPPEADRRRAAIPPDLLPPNPYAPETTSPD
jgi:mono/diheme cytochrome c family protein